MKKIKIKPSKVGSLHKALGVPQGEKIPASKLKIKDSDSPAMKKKKQFAINAKKWKKEFGGVTGTTMNNPYGGMMGFPEIKTIGHGIKSNAPLLSGNILKDPSGFKDEYGRDINRSDPRAKEQFMNNYSNTIPGTLMEARGVDSEQLIEILSKAGGALGGGMFKYGGKLKKAQNGTIMLEPSGYFPTSYQSVYLPENPTTSQFQMSDQSMNTTNSDFSYDSPDNEFGSQQPNYSQPQKGAKKKSNSKPIFTNALGSSGNYFQDAYQNAVLATTSDPITQGAALMKAGLNLGKGVSDIVGSVRYNKQTKRIEDDLKYNQLSGIFNTPYSTYYTDDVRGDMRNPMMMAFGGKVINLMRPQPMSMPKDIDAFEDNLSPNIEAEKGEFVQTPQGLAGKINSGSSHSNGGTEMNLPPESIVFSEKLKHPTLKKSYAKIAKKYSTEKDLKHLASSKDDIIGENTAKINLQMKNEQLQKLFQEQEINKIEGKHGASVKKNTLKELGIMKHGGKLKKYQDGGDPWKQEKFSTTPGIFTPTGINLNLPPEATWEDHRNLYEQIARQAGELAPNERFKDAAQLQEFMYDYNLDRAGGIDRLNNMWKTYGVTNYNEPLYKDLQAKIDKGEKLSVDDLSRLRGNFIDNKKGKRLVSPSEEFTPLTPRGASPLSTPVPNKMDKIPFTKDPVKQKTSNQFLPFPMPNFYTEEPLYTSQLKPNLINYRPLDVEPPLNEIRRTTTLSGKNLRSNPIGMSNKAQLQANALNAINQTFGNKFNQEQQGKMGVDQFNAQVLGQTDQLNLNEKNRFLDLIQRRKGVLDTQIRTDKAQQAQNWMLANQWNQSKDYIESTFNPYSQYAGQGIPLIYTPQITNFNETPKKKANGGKLKLKKRK